MCRSPTWESDINEFTKELNKFIKNQRLWVIQRCLLSTHSIIIHTKRRRDVIDHVKKINLLPSTLKRWIKIANRFDGLTYEQAKEHFA